MSTLVVHESMWCNTRAVAEAVAEGLRERVGDVEVLDVARAPSPLPHGVDLLVAGGPTHAFSMSRASTRRDAVTKGAEPGHEARGLREWLDALPSHDRLAVATFDTRVAKVRRFPGSAAKAAAKEVRRHHLGRLVDVESFWVDDMAGPLLEGELDRARAWGASLAEHLAPH
ncbi:flavodoxin family protein [Nocardioides solisilvae]|uniref:flavodoxin family protein n=1 Tax=Nocardioides solisilvae TaxID=1542435 RepID=UPI000D741F81|nr:flavodoxin family protein [Nocardioides solisilvae]